MLFASFAVASRDDASSTTDNALPLHGNHLPDALVLLLGHHPLTRHANMVAVAATDALSTALTSAI